MVSPPYQGFCMSTLVDPCACRYDQHRGLFGNCPLACAYHVTLCFHAGRFLPLSNVWSTVVVGGGGTRSAHIKQWCFSISSDGYVCGGANPPPDLVPKPKKPLQLPSVGTLRKKPRARACVTAFNSRFLRQRLNYKHN